MVGTTKIALSFFRFKPAFNWNRFLGDLRRGLNSLNSDTDTCLMHGSLIALHDPQVDLKVRQEYFQVPPVQINQPIRKKYAIN